MVKCPKCAANVDHLRAFILHWSEQRFELYSDGCPKYTHDKVVMYDPLETEYNCPECDTTLFKTETEAIAFLNRKEDK